MRLRGAAAARVHVVSVRIHPQFNPVTLANDLALLELSRPVAGAATLDDGTVGQSGSVAGASGTRATALGWGSTTASPEGEFPDALRQTEIDIEPDVGLQRGLRRRLRRREHALRGRAQGRP